ncbi:uncharacterized protein [Dysidea avara]|uniref:uncharacterized protein n=1 Tax=Dysidea avara TaxID=196820 RepID=UPI003326B9E3
MTRRASWIVLLVVVFVVAVGGQGDDSDSRYNYVEESCYNMMPSQMMESNMPSQNVETSTVLAKFMNRSEAMYTYEPGHEYSIIISSEKDDFMGFIANMRLASNSSVIVGTVSEPNRTTTSSSVKTMTCNGNNNTATQMSITQHFSVEFVWTAPPDLNETVILMYGVFKNRTVFWSNLTSHCITPVGFDPSVVNQICTTVSSLPSPSTTSTKSISTSPITSQSLFSPSMSSIASTITTIQPSSSSRPSVHLSSVPNFNHHSLIVLPSVSRNFHSAVIRSTVTKRTVISSTFLLSTTFTFKYTSVSVPVQTSTRTTDTSSALPIIPTAVVGSSDGSNSLIENTSEVMAIGIAICFVLVLIVLQVVIVFVGCAYRRRHKQSRSRSSSFRTLYSLDTASVRSESIRRSNRLYSRENCQIDLKLNIIEVDDNDCSSSPAPRNQCQPLNQSEQSCTEVDVHSTTNSRSFQ